MLDTTRYDLKILAVPKQRTMFGEEREGYDFSFTLRWDGFVWVEGMAPDPVTLGKCLGAAIEGMAVSANESLKPRGT